MSLRLLLVFLVFFLTFGPLTMSEASTDPSVTATMNEPLLEASVASLQTTLYTLRTKLDRTDPSGMYGYVHGTRLLIQRGLTLAEEQQEHAETIKQALIPVTYNLAADTWTGLPDDEGNPAYLRIGLEAATLNLKLRREKQQTGQKLAMGLWMLGVHQLAAGDYVSAQTTFEEYRSVAEDGDEPSAMLMAHGWLIMTQILAGDARKEDLSTFDKIRKDLSAQPDGKFYVRQMDTALERFSD
ncbi:MAG: hypothetical protein AAF525_11420 [Pseudomonadota bacterium]